MKNRIFLTSPVLLLLFFLNISGVNAQIIEIKGSVKDGNTRRIIQNATLSLADSNVSTITNDDGTFLLKIPQDSNNTIVVTALGYQDKSIQLSSKDQKLEIFLNSSNIDLTEVNITTFKNARALVDKVFDSNRKNYIKHLATMTGFYRETIKKGRRNAALAEAVITVYKEPYNSASQDKIAIVKSRKDTDYSRLDTIALKLQGGPFATLYTDIMKYPEYIFTPVMMDAYDFTFGVPTEIDGASVYQVHFKQKNNVIDALYYGDLFIESTSLTLVKASYALDVTSSEKVAKIFVKKRPRNVRVQPREIQYEVNYRSTDEGWQYAYGRADLSFEVKKRRNPFKSTYSLSCEMAITDWNKSYTIIPKTGLITNNIIMSDETTGFEDPDFWGAYNVIEPEKSIESAIRKIRRRLKKEDTRSGLGGK